jgi:hypothetical protein
MILNSLELNKTYRSNTVINPIVNALKKEISAQEEITKWEGVLQRNRLTLGSTYLRMLESGKHLGC